MRASLPGLPMSRIRVSATVLPGGTGAGVERGYNRFAGRPARDRPSVVVDSAA
jgi:hypothetical protein